MAQIEADAAKTGNKRKWTLCVLSAFIVAVMTACSDQAANRSAAPSASAGESPSGVRHEASAIDWDARIVLNKKAGKITYVTGFNYAASSPDVNAVVADELGYFEKLGLNVEVVPGLDPDGMKLISTGKAQIASAGSASLVIQSVANGAEIKGIALMSEEGLAALMVLDDSGIRTPKDLEGKTVGYKGALPSHFKAMFNHAGADISKIEFVGVGFDPTILNTTDVDAVTVFKSNEPIAMNDLGFKVRLLDPKDYGVPTSFGVVAANAEFLASYPSAAEDFLRALFKAHEFIVANPDEAVSILASRSEMGYNLETEKNRLKAEIEIIANARVAGKGLGWQTEEHWQKEIDMLSITGAISRAVTVDEAMDNKPVSSIYRGDKLIWIE
ncbi:ABC transporter substrate-binding protein [Paenibacillaceae bacterium WGS1546]|uniref:ABC transporter substrate-binding protein n=1 Tax=Cohnella sp. WGS1546 TaxID=3366810 RepID=UPI00372D6CE9